MVVCSSFVPSPTTPPTYFCGGVNKMAVTGVESDTHGGVGEYSNTLELKKSQTHGLGRGVTIC